MHRAVVEAITPITGREGIRPEVRLAEVDGTLHVYVSFANEPGEILIEEIRRAAWLASTRASHGRAEVVAHVALQMRAV
ncbi:hypothetical protein [Planobispora longispora]|nr:hypothetical protein [Planobispora longispora]